MKAESAGFVAFEMSGGEFRRDGYRSRLAREPVSEIKASEDEGTDRHIEDEDFGK